MKLKLKKIPNKEFEKEAKKLLTIKNKIKISKPNKKEMEKEFRKEWEIYKKSNPNAKIWQFAKIFMKKKIGLI